MPFLIRPFRGFPVQCSVTYNAGPFQGEGTVWNLSYTGWRLSGDLPMRPGETLSLTVTLPNERRIIVPKRSCGGHKVRGLPWRISPSSRILAPGSNITAHGWCRNRRRLSYG